MPTRLQSLLQPLNLAAVVTLLTVALSIQSEPGDPRLPAWLLLGAFTAVFLWIDTLDDRPRLCAAGYAFLAASALAVVWLAPRTGTSPVMLVILIAALAMDYPPRRVVPAALALNVALYLVLRASGHEAPLLVVVLYVGFQAFAALVAHYARSAERARDRLALVNADLLATRALLSDSARDAERLRVARELHDVAGHTLTAMNLNLRVLAADPAFAGHPQVALLERLAGGLMGDIRGVVEALRDARGLDLETAMHALAAPLPDLRLQLSIDPQVQVTDAATAEALLRLVQEALTNSARHAGASRLHVAISESDGQLRVAIDDDGRVRKPLHEGNGLTGMRERILAAGGSLALATTPSGSLRIDAKLPA